MNGKGQALLLENGNRSNLFRPVLSHPKLDDRGNLLAPKRWMKLKDGKSCMVFTYEVKAQTGYGALNTKVIHRWNIKSVLRRAGVRC